MKDLVKIIKENPGCKFIVDNDSWTCYPKGYEMGADGVEELASDGHVIPLGDGGYGSGNCYGGDILQALAKIVGVEIESV